MDYRKTRNTHKRQREEENADNTPMNKRIKPTLATSDDEKPKKIGDSSSTTANQPMKFTEQQQCMEQERSKPAPQPNVFNTKLTDVNVDCLERIFKHLNLEELLIIADLNKHLKLAADLVFASRFGKTSLQIDSRSRSIQLNSTNQIPWSFRFKLFRCFGHLITNLVIYHTNSSKSGPHLARYINEYCAESLINISLANCEANILSNLKKPFTKVESVCFSDSDLGNSLLNSSKWIPNVRRLSFSGVNGILTGCDSKIDVHGLQELSVYVPFDAENNFNVKHLAEILRLNPNLQSLFISGYINFKHLQSVSEHLHLEKLTIKGTGQLTNLDGTTVHFPTVKHLKLDHVYLNDGVADLISKCTSITKLTYDGYKYGEEGALLKMASPSLVEVDLGLCAFHSIDEAFSFVDKCTSLNKFTFRINGKDDEKAVREQFEREWRKVEAKGGCCHHTVTMER